MAVNSQIRSMIKNQITSQIKNQFMPSPSPTELWILESGFWDDLNKWLDFKTWFDG